MNTKWQCTSAPIRFIQESELQTELWPSHLLCCGSQYNGPALGILSLWNHLQSCPIKCSSTLLSFISAHIEWMHCAPQVCVYHLPLSACTIIVSKRTRLVSSLNDRVAPLVAHLPIKPPTIHFSSTIVQCVMRIYRHCRFIYDQTYPRRSALERSKTTHSSESGWW